MFSPFPGLLTVFLILYPMFRFSFSCPNYWKGFTNVFVDVIPNSPITMVSKHLTVACASVCRDEAHCVAFAFHQQRRECHMYTRNVKELNTDPDPGMQVYLMITEGSNLVSIQTPSTSSVGVLHSVSAAIDNNHSSCFQTDKGDYQPWFLVDLVETFLIHFILVYNEAQYPERLHDVNYEVYDSDPTINTSSEGNCCASVVDYNTGKNIIRCKDGVHGRFVKISIEKSNLLTVCGLEIYGTPMKETSDTCNQKYECKKLPEGDNIALRKPTRQSSTYFHSEIFSPTSSMAVDGNKSGIFKDESCTHTDFNDYNPWWQVDLGWMYDITSITISNRYAYNSNDAEDRLSDVSVLVYDSDPSVGNPPSKLCKFLPGVFGFTVRTFKCGQTTISRFIRISKPTQYLTLCEVEVTGIKQ